MPRFTTTQQAACELEIINRLFTGILPGNRLDKFKGSGNALKVYDYPQWEIKGESDLPLITVMEYTDYDGMFAGAMTGTGTNAEKRAKLNVNILTECTMNLVLACSRINGLTRKRASDAPGLRDWVAVIKDCIENKIDQVTPDKGLNGTCQKPIMISARDNSARNVDWAIMLEVKYSPLATLSGTRSDPWDADEVTNPAIVPDAPRP